MPRILLDNGTTKEVSYDTAAKILEVLNGNREPKDKAQAAFVLHVTDVQFESLPTAAARYNPNKLPKPDPVLRSIVNNKELVGYSRYEAVRDHLRTKHNIRQS
jgi:hypothetical protein